MKINKIIASNFSFVCFIVLLGVLYIGNAHMAERKMRKIKTLKSDIREIKARYIASEKELKSRGSKMGLNNELDKMGLKEPKEIPETIIIKKEQ